MTHTLGSGDTSAQVGFSASVASAEVVGVYRGVDSTNPVDVTAPSGVSPNVYNTYVDTPVLQTTQPGDEIVYIAGATNASTSPMTYDLTAGMSQETSATSGTGGATAVLADQPGPTPAGFVGGTLTTLQGNGDPSDGFVALRPATVTTSTTCNDLNLPTSVTTPAPAGQSGTETTTSTYDAAGRLLSTLAPSADPTNDPSGQETTYSYDPAGNLISQTSGVGSSTAATTSYCYDPNGDRTAVVAPDGNTSGVATCSTSSPWTTSSPYQTTYAYDSLGDLASETRPASTAAPNGAVTSYTYDPAGDVLTSTDPNGVTTTNTYTPTGLVATTSYSDGTHGVTDTYDANGNLVSQADASGTTTKTWDPFGELTSETNGAGQTVAYAYDTQGNVTAITYPLPSSATWAQSDTVTYAYDPAGNLTQVADFNNNPVMVTNDTSGNADNLVLGSPTYGNTASNDAVTTFEDPTGAPQRITLSNYGASLASFSYSDAPAGNVLKETDTPTSASSPASYTYDAQSRVTGETPGTGTASTYGFDPSGNLTTLPNGATGIYNDASELTSSSLSGTATSFTYDANGNRTGSSTGGKATSTATWNGAGELTSYSNAASNMSAATYAADGLRQSETTGTGSSAVTQDFTWDTVGSIPQLLMDATNAYLYAGANAPIEQVNLSTGDLSYLVTDALGSVRDVVSSTGSITASTSYGAWGTPTTSGGVASATPFGFAGGYTDPTGLIYLINRYYDPGTGQFLSVDPMVATTGAPYAYANGNPISEADINGMCSIGQASSKWICISASSDFATVGSTLEVYRPFYNAVTSGASANISLAVLWYGIYQRNAYITPSTSSLLSNLQTIASETQPSQAGNTCLGVTYVVEFECAVAAVTKFYGNFSGGSTPEAYGVLQNLNNGKGEQNLQWFVEYSDHSALAVTGWAVQLYSEALNHTLSVPGMGTILKLVFGRLSVAQSVGGLTCDNAATTRSGRFA